MLLLYTDLECNDNSESATKHFISASAPIAVPVALCAVRYGAKGMAEATDVASFTTRSRLSAVLPSSIAANASATDWKADLAIGAGHQQALVTPSERKSRAMLLSLTSRSVLTESALYWLISIRQRIK